MGSIVHASTDPSRTGIPGDQTGQEVKVGNWYNKGWTCVIRYSDANLAAQIASVGVKLANSNLVGYDQSTRANLVNALRKYNYNVDEYIKSGEKTNADCSSFAHACICCVIGDLRELAPPTTSGFPSACSGRGFSVIRDSNYLNNDSQLLPGDLIDKEGTHIVIYVGDTNSLPEVTGNSAGNSSASSTTTSTKFIYKKQDALLREVGYLKKSNLTPSITKSKVRLSLVNTAMFESIIGSSSNSYNYDALGQNEKIIVQFILNKGLNLAAAIGDLANIDAESGCKPDAVNKSSGASGICQWMGNRKTKMIATVPNWKTNLTGQLEFFWNELITGYSEVYSALQSVQDTLEGCKSAADVFCRKFEIPTKDAAKMQKISETRQESAAKFWNKCSVISNTPNNPAMLGDSPIPTGNALKVVSIPADVNQTGIIPNNTNYSYWFPKWRYTQRKIADEWANEGKPHNEYVATIGGYRLAAVAPVFGTTGDLIKVTLEDDTEFGCILADAKGADAQSPWGHIMGTGKVDIIEWEMAGSSTVNDDTHTRDNLMKLTGLRGKKVKSIANYGQYKQW